VTVAGESGDSISVTFTNGTHTLTKTVTGTGSAQAVQLTSADLTTLTNGTISVSATQTDAAGNAQTAAAATTSFVLDTTAPTVTVSETHSEGSGTFTYTFSEAVTGFTTGDLSFGSRITSHGSLVHVGIDGSGHDVYTQSFIYGSSGTRSATVGTGYTDLAGNAGTGGTTGSFPAGIAGEPINLALTDPSGVGALTTVTISGMPADWNLNKGTNLGNGTWTVETNDLSALRVLTAAAYAGAMVLGVTETWANADGTTGTAFVSDNIEAYAPGSPIFAWSGADTLTGAGGHDLFVFAQPIGNDTIYNFNVATDKIDLTGFAGIASFGDIAGHIADDGHGDAVITLGAGETITLHGVDAASLTAADFVFNQTPVVENAGTMVVSDGAVLPLGGIIDNTGTIALNSTGDETDLQIIGDGVTLQGGGYLTLSDSHENIIFGTSSATTLTNVDNTISGAGQIGIGDGNLTLVNEAHGTIDANISGGTLTLDTGHTITNDGLMEATNGGTLQIDDAVSGSGSAIIAGGTLIFDVQSNMSVTFDNGPGAPAYGDLVLGHASDFSGQISGFTGSAPDTTHSDGIDLKDISFGSNITFAYGDNTGTDKGGTLTIFEAGNTVDSITFANGEYTAASFTLSSDGSGGTLITDPPTSTTTAGPTTTSSSDSADTLIGGSNGNNTIAGGDDTLTGGGHANQTLIGNGNNDSFVFTPGFGHVTITNFQPTTDVLQIDHSVFENVQALLAATQDDGHGNVVITADAHDAITLQHVTVAQLQAHQSDFHII
jgi:hypothetical protein